MHTIESLQHAAPEIESKLHYTFRDRSLLMLAFIHRSFLNENRMVPHHNERLEFLGDSILGMLAAEYLYRHLPEMPEGDLSYLRSRLVEASSCMAYVQKLDLGKHLLLGKGERMNDGRGRESILADLFEAIIGAIYLDGGLGAARDFLFNNFDPEIKAILKTPLSNWKAMLQDYCQKKFQHAPVYQVIEESGPDHSKFLPSLSSSATKNSDAAAALLKEAQQAAAADAWSRIEEEKK